MADVTDLVAELQTVNAGVGAFYDQLSGIRKELRKLRELCSKSPQPFIEFPLIVCDDHNRVAQIADGGLHVWRGKPCIKTTAGGIGRGFGGADLLPWVLHLTISLLIAVITILSLRELVERNNQ